jgi:SOS response regulatory protein OraA/RecX
MNMNPPVKITKLQQGVRRSWRVNVYLDGEYWASCDEKTIMRLELAVGQEHELAALAMGVGESEHLQYAVDYLLNYPATSVRRMRGKLEKREAPVEVIDQVVERCVQMHYLDDEELARMLIRAGQREGRSQRQIRGKFRTRELREDELPEEIWDEYDVRAAFAAALKRNRRKTPEKQTAALQRAGFGWDMISDGVPHAPIVEGTEAVDNPPVSYSPPARPELDDAQRAKLAAKMQRLYRKDGDERKATAWGARHGLSFEEARLMWLEGRPPS